MTIQTHLPTPQLSARNLPARSTEAAEAPQASNSDQVQLSNSVDQKEAQKAEGKKLLQASKASAIFGGVAGGVAAGALASIGGVVGAAVGSTVGFVLGAAGMVAGGALGAKLAIDYADRKNIISAPGIFLVLGGAVAGAAAGGLAGFYGGGALGMAAGAKGGLLAAGVGALSGAPVGAMVGGLSKAGWEVYSKPEEYPHLNKELMKD